MNPIQQRRAQCNRVARGLASRGQSNRFARGPGSLPESNSAVVNPNLHDRCFRVARQAPSLYGATEGSANEAADVRLESFGLSRGPSAAAESAFREGAIAQILRDAFGGERRSRDGEAPGRKRSVLLSRGGVERRGEGSLARDECRLRPRESLAFEQVGEFLAGLARALGARRVDLRELVSPGVGPGGVDDGA